MHRGLPLGGWLKEVLRPYYLRSLYFPFFPQRRPAAFTDCWRFPYRRVIAGDARLPDTATALPDVLFYPMTDWHTRIQRTQHLARSLAALGYRCIYLNPHLGREFETVRRRDPSHRLSQLADNLFELHVRLPREPVFHERPLFPAEEDIIVATVRDVLPARTTAVQIVSFPVWRGVTERLRSESRFPVIYDCHDLLSGFQKIHRDLIAAEGRLLAEADLVLFSSRGLADRYHSKTRQCIIIRNAVAAEAFQAASAPVAGPPVAGYVGALDSWFDVEAVERAASLNPQCRFIVAGHVDYAPIRRLSLLSNVELTGEVPYERVPELLARFRVGLIPFTITPLTLMTNPIKLYEYFSRGLPVVSAALPEAEAMGDLVYLASTPADFARQVQKAVAEDDPALMARRKEVAARESWAARAREISSRFPALMEKNASRRH